MRKQYTGVFIIVLILTGCVHSSVQSKLPGLSAQTQTFPPTREAQAVVFPTTPLASLQGVQITPDPTPTQRIQQPFPEDIVQAIDQLARRAVYGPPLAGLELAVDDGAYQAFSAKYGTAQVDRGQPVTDTTVFEIASVSKQFTAAAILQLAEKGSLRLDDPARRYIPNLPESARDVTIRSLLNHTSGLPDAGSLSLPLSGIHEYDPHEWTEWYADHLSALLSPPGSQWRYNNEGYNLLGEIVEQTSGMDYADYIQQNLLQPLGLASTRYCLPKSEDVAQGYVLSGGQLSPVLNENLSLLFAAGGLCSTATDLVRWVKALSSGQVLRPETYREMVTPQTLSGGQPLSYGYGLNVGQFAGRNAIFHGGSLSGFQSIVVVFPDDDLRLALLSNTNWAGSTALNTLAEQIAHLLLSVRDSPNASH